MPRVTLSYSTYGLIEKEYEVPQEIIDQGSEFVEEWIWDRGEVPVYVSDTRGLQLESMEKTNA